MENIQLATDNSQEFYESSERQNILRSVFSNVGNLRVVDLSKVFDEKEVREEWNKATLEGMSAANFSELVFNSLQSPENKEALEKLKVLFSGKVLLDIGSGWNVFGYKLAETLGAGTYIAVEPYYPKNLANKLKQEITAPSIPYFVLDADALQALTETIPGAANMISIGTDAGLITDKHYCEQVDQLLHDKLGPNTFLGSETVFYPKGSEAVLRFGDDHLTHADVFRNMPEVKR